MHDTDAMEQLFSSSVTEPQPVLIKSKRKIWLDAIKGLAIITVVFTHSTPIPYLQSFLETGYMPLFYIAAGYTFKDEIGAVSKRWSKLIKPYLFWSVIYIILNTLYEVMMHTLSLESIGMKCAGIIYSRYSLFPIDTEDYVRLLSPGSAPLWFITSLLLSFIFLIPLLRLKGRRLWALIVLYFAASFGMTYLPVLLPWSLDTALLGAMFIRLGYYLKGIRLQSLSIVNSFIVCAILFALLSSFFRDGINMSVREYGMYEGWSLWIFFPLGIIYTLTLATFFMLTEKSKTAKVFASFGKMSLFIMCAHMVFVTAFTCFNKLAPTIGLGFVLPELLIPVISTLCCWIAYQAIKKLQQKYHFDTTWLGC